tara:strand:+ start:337 stop:1098 length:762 start_codon:yes stop_codon:yes gene_type:complete
MRLVFLVIPILLNFFYCSLIKAEEKIDPEKNKIENIVKKESITEVESAIRKIHIVKIGDTISSISKFYSINKNSIIKLNNLKDENYIFVGQNLIISESNENNKKQIDLVDGYHIVQMGENLTEISNKYKVNLGYLIEINNLKNPDSIKVGDKLLLSNNSPISSENYQIIKNKENKELMKLDKQNYGPIIIQDKSYEEIKGRKVLNVLNQQNKKLILSIDCNKNELDVRIPGRKWRGGEPAKEDFEKKLINDFC